HNGAYTHCQLPVTDGLGDEIVSTSFEGFNDTRLVGQGADHDDGNGGLLADLAADVQAVSPGQVDIQQHQLRLILLPACNGGGTVGHAHDLKAELAQRVARHVEYLHIILCQKNS